MGKVLLFEEMILGLFFAAKLLLVSLARCILKPAFVFAGKDSHRGSLASSPLESTLQYGLLASGHTTNLCLYFSLDVGMLHL